MSYNDDYREYVRKLKNTWGDTFVQPKGMPFPKPPKFLEPLDPSVLVPPPPPMPPTPEEFISEMGEPPKTHQEWLERMNKILFASEQDTAMDAVYADVFDAIFGVIPVVSDVFGLTRVIDAQQKKNETAVIINTIDSLIGAVPIVGDVVDALLPANSVNYWMTYRDKKGKR